MYRECKFQIIILIPVLEITVDFKACEGPLSRNMLNKGSRLRLSYDNFSPWTVVVSCVSQSGRTGLLRRCRRSTGTAHLLNVTVCYLTYASRISPQR